jgi:hypothetical protein
VKLNCFFFVLRLILNKVALRRQQSSEDEAGQTTGAIFDKSQSVLALLAQKKIYQKHLRNMQQNSLARDVLHGEYLFIFFICHTILLVWFR